MEKIKLIELCSGVGAQAKGIEKTGLFNVEPIATADLDKEVVVSYAAIHCGLTPEIVENYDDYPSKEDMVEELTRKRLGYDFQKDKPYDWAKLSKRKDKMKGIEKYWLADKLSKNLGDVTQIKELPECDMLTYSFPCTDWSQAGKMEGGDWTCQDCGEKYNPADYSVKDRYECPLCGSHNIKSTRSGLLYEAERFLVNYKDRDILPKYLLMENVDALVSKKFISSFNDWLDRLENIGYKNYYKVINAKECGTPQNRKRIFVISIRKDIDTGKFEFPKPFDGGLRLKDVLEDKVEDKYYLSDEVQQRLKITDPTFTKNIIGTTKPEFRTIGQRDLVYRNDADYMGALVATDYKQPKALLDKPIENTYELKQVGQLYGTDREPNPQAGRVYDAEYISPTMDTCSGGNRQVKVLVPQATKSGYIECEPGGVADLSYPNSKTRRGRVQEGGTISPTITATETGVSRIELDKSGLRVRKLTPLECHRLMNFDDEDWHACENMGTSDTQGYKQAGNSIVCNCISLLAEHLYKAQYDESYICADENFIQPQA